MIRNLLTTIASGAILCTGILSNAVAADFNHTASIPANADLSTVRFEKARLVTVHTKARQTFDAQYCAEVAARASGGSAFCPATAAGEATEAYEITYSYKAPKADWDETPATRSSFTVLYRPEELSPAIQRALAARHANRAEIADYFAVKTSRETIARRTVDESRSSFCDGSFVEGSWMHTDSKCADTIAWKTVSSPSGFLTVSVDLAEAHLTAGIRTRQ